MFKCSLRFVFMAWLTAHAFIFVPVSYVYANNTRLNQSDMNVWFVAAKENDTILLRQFIEQKFPLESRDDKGRTALLVATYHNSIAAAKLLIEAGANVNAKDHKQDSPYLYAGAEGKLEILKLTVAAGADLKSINRYGGTALTPAAHHGHVEVVRYLVTTDVDINQVNNLGWTALLEAVILGNGNQTYQQIVKILLKAGADKKITDDNNDTPLDHAKMKNQKEIIKLLENY